MLFLDEFLVMFIADLEFCRNAHSGFELQQIKSAAVLLSFGLESF